MSRRICAVLLILLLCFCNFSCTVTDEKENPSANEGADNNLDEVTEEIKKPSVSEQMPADDQHNTYDDINSKQPDESKKTDDVTTTETKYNVTYDYGYNNKTASVTTSCWLKEVEAERKGYYFLGWYYDDVEWSFGYHKVEQDMTLVAKWQPIEYSIKYEFAGGFCLMSAPDTYTIEDEVVINDVPNNVNFEFEGWHTGDTSAVSKELIIPKGTTGDLVVYAAWKEKSIFLGKFEQDNNKNTTSEPIEWLAVGQKNGLTLLVSKYAIYAMPYQKYAAGATWATSDIRKWCNEDFYSTAFSSGEKAVIMKSHVEKAESPFDNPLKCDAVSTYDKIFILSYEEFLQYLPSTDSRKCKATRYLDSISDNLINNKGLVNWWLRNNVTKNTACIVKTDGSPHSTGYYQSMTDVAIRPAMWVDTEKLNTLQSR